MAQNPSKVFFSDFPAFCGSGIRAGTGSPAAEFCSRALGIGVLVLALQGCAGTRTVDQSVGHIDDASQPLPLMQPIVDKPPVLPVPEPLPPVETYTVVVKDVPVKDLLFSLARDAGLELDIQADSERTITINAVDQPLPSILGRIADQAGLRFVLSARNLIVDKDLPYWHSYHVDYVNVSRDSVGEVGVATQIATSGGTVAEESSGGQQDKNGNLSKTTVTNRSSNDFWTVLESSLKSLVANQDKEQGGDQPFSPQEFDPVIVNRMAGVVTVLGTQKKHHVVQRFLDKIAANSQRQVLIEMTIVEVELSDRYQAGVDWQGFTESAASGGNGAALDVNLLGANLGTSPFVSLGINDFNSDGSGIAASISLLQQFGDTKVLSSPKIMALNNQTAMLKVVNENVFFTIELDIQSATVNVPERRTYTSEIHTVPVGLVMSVTPQISERGYVSLNIRPTISRITGYAVDPAPRLADANFDNLIPEIQVREIESLLQVLDGRTIVLGGLMQNEIKKNQDGVPGLSRIPKIGGLFSYTNDELVKTELIIFLKPTIVSGAESPAGTKGVRDYFPEFQSSTGN